MKCIVSINLYKFTGDDIGLLRKKQVSYRHVRKFIPDYCIHPETGKIIDSEQFLQFVEDGEKEFYLFDFLHTHQPVQWEVEEVGYDTAYEKIDFRSLIKSGVLILLATDYNRVVAPPIYLVFEWKSGIEDDPNEVSLIGYLNQELDLIKV